MNGAYHYWMNGTRTDITESFRFISNGTSATVIESLRHAETFGSQIKVIARYTENQLTHFDIEWHNTNADAVNYASAQYRFEATEIHVHRDLDGREFHEYLPKPQTFTVLPLLRVFMGTAIRQAYSLGHGNQIPVLVPNIQDPNDAVQLLALELSPRSVVQLGTETLTIDGTQHPADLFNFHGGNYDRSAKFWVGENDLLLKYEWQQNDIFWEVKLVNHDG